ncbi:MAG: hypothetical protein P4L43_10530 [Syntrophobacteraceae bacterium]|nr:hypothetical protein [Syntrophobacteraceae bacterium]
MLKRPAPDALPAPLGSLFMRLPGWLWRLFTLTVLLSLATANPLPTALCLLVLPVLILASWRRGEVPVLTFGLGWQWLEVTLPVFWADVQGLPVTDTTLLPWVGKAIWLSLIGLVVLAAGVYAGLRISSRRWRWEASGSIDANWNLSRLFRLYVAASLASLLLFALSGVSEAIRQPLLTLAGVHWVFFFLLLLTVLRSKRGYPLLAAVTGWEIVASLGFWSGFKTPLFYLVLALFTVDSRLTFKRLAVGSAFVVALIFLGCVWTSIKGPYREFLNEGTGQQAVLVSPGQRVAELGHLLAGWSLEDLPDGLERLAERISYVEYFAAVLGYVPAVVPYQNGLIWRTGVENLIPRLFWPGKPALNDSDITRRYTGIMVSGANEGTSIGIGYMAESYVDFGPYGMFVPIFLLGILWGGIYAYFVSRPHPAAVNYAFAVTALMDSVSVETSATKIVAGLVLGLLFLGLLLRYFMPKVEAWLSAGSVPAPELPVEQGLAGERGGKAVGSTKSLQHLNY